MYRENRIQRTGPHKRRRRVINTDTKKLMGFLEDALNRETQEVKQPSPIRRHNGRSSLFPPPARSPRVSMPRLSTLAPKDSPLNQRIPPKASPHALLTMLAACLPRSPENTEDMAPDTLRDASVNHTSFAFQEPSFSGLDLPGFAKRRSSLLNSPPRFTEISLDKYEFDSRKLSITSPHINRALKEELDGFFREQLSHTPSSQSHISDVVLGSTSSTQEISNLLIPSILSTSSAPLATEEDFSNISKVFSDEAIKGMAPLQLEISHELSKVGAEHTLDADRIQPQAAQFYASKHPPDIDSVPTLDQKESHHGIPPVKEWRVDQAPSFSKDVVDHLSFNDLSEGSPKELVAKARELPIINHAYELVDNLTNFSPNEPADDPIAFNNNGLAGELVEGSANNLKHLADDLTENLSEDLAANLVDDPPEDLAENIPEDLVASLAENLPGGMAGVPFENLPKNLADDPIEFAYEELANNLPETQIQDLKLVEDPTSFAVDVIGGSNQAIINEPYLEADGMALAEREAFGEFDPLSLGSEDMPKEKPVVKFPEKREAELNRGFSILGHKLGRSEFGLNSGSKSSRSSARKLK
ncbi:hypothetical protein L0F63_003486 [Massospora cicadina]|nr:hypothetical protein L0F63_003486 [Massospora cicadina]